jgi:hypothetical protein
LNACYNPNVEKNSKKIRGAGILEIFTGIRQNIHCGRVKSSPEKAFI